MTPYTDVKLATLRDISTLRDHIYNLEALDSFGKRLDVLILGQLGELLSQLDELSRVLLLSGYSRTRRVALVTQRVVSIFSGFYDI